MSENYEGQDDAYATVGHIAPNFSCSAVMQDGTIEELNLKAFTKGKSCVLFFYPADFTFVCPSEIIAMDRRIEEFNNRNCCVIGVSVDSQFSHSKWREMSPKEGGIGPVKFPLVADINKDISLAWGVLSDEGVALRGTFIIDQESIIRHASINDLPIGRNIDEYLRILDALDHFKKHGQVCPAGWTAGKDAMEPTSDGVKRYLSKNSDSL
ncbi:peroxiredoxin [Candidatus Sneabacter namystus]|uniref:Peroxiredoxin n=1 Tax=Candidatus Sneabacter namystus TaxID=2601646 RepID=A0A5C0UJN5_9RICK|nr:peroxiredoxin [Candidatus Sneabacter namystus]QEK39733.1 peroxiredoxin [Candidatus Sneabacter namystus]